MPKISCSPSRGIPGPTAEADLGDVDAATAAATGASAQTACMSGSELALGLLVHYLLHARNFFAHRKPNLHVSLQAHALASRALMTDLGELGEYIIEPLLLRILRQRHAFSVVSALPIRSMRLHRCDFDWKHINARGAQSRGGGGHRARLHMRP